MASSTRLPTLHWTEVLSGLLVLAALGLLYFTDDAATRSLALVLVVTPLMLQCATAAARALRTGRIAGLARADRPAAYWSATIGLILLIPFVIAILALALQD